MPPRPLQLYRLIERVDPLTLTPCSPNRLAFDATTPVAGLKVGYIEQWMKESPATDVDRGAMETIKKLKMELKAVTLPDWP